MLQGDCCDSTEMATVIPTGQRAAGSITLEVTPQQHHHEGDGHGEGNATGGFAIDQRDK